MKVKATTIDDKANVMFEIYVDRSDFVDALLEAVKEGRMRLVPN